MKETKRKWERKTDSERKRTKCFSHTLIATLYESFNGWIRLFRFFILYTVLRMNGEHNRHHMEFKIRKERDSSKRKKE